MYICIDMDQGEPGLDYDDPNLNPLECDICKQKFDSLDKLGAPKTSTWYVINATWFEGK